MIEGKRFLVEEVIPLEFTEKGGIAIQRDLALSYDGKTFVLSVGTQDYLDNIKKYNETFSPDMQIDENVLVLKKVDRLEDIIGSISNMNVEEIIPYLTEQKED